MDDDDFEDLFAEVEMLAGSSQESLTTAAANLVFDNRPSIVNGPPSTPATSANSQEFVDFTVEHRAADNVPNRSSGLQVPEPSTVVEQIESIFEHITEGLADGDSKLTVELKARPTPSMQRGNHFSPTLAKTKSICFPGRTAAEAWRFTVVIRILELMHEALSADVVLSKRDIYYRDPALFGTQAVVDRYVDDIAFTFNVSRSKLNVTAAAKGLVAGAFRFCRRDGSILDAASDRDGSLVPPLREVLSVDLAAVKWILIIEKEATFRSIASSSFWDIICTRGVILTGKGYPDIATRALLHFLSTASPQNGFASPPVFGLADCDPDGLAILSIYRNGSAALSHENDDLRVPLLQWLGLRLEHMVDESLLHNSQGLLGLTARDRRRAVKMLERSGDSDSEEELHMNVALQTMLMLNTKAELQLLDAVPGGMTNLLASALGSL